MKIAQQLRLPVVPGARTYTPDVADRQHGQQVEPFPGLNRLCKVAHRAGFRQVALLGHVSHQEMVADKPLDRLYVTLREPESSRGLAGDMCSEDRVVLLAPLSDVVQQERRVEDLSVDASFQDAACHRQFLDQFAAFDPCQVRDALDGVLVHRVVVVHVELHHRHDGLEFRNKCREHAEFVHAPERSLGVPVFKKRIEENPVCFGRPAHFVVNQVEVRRDQPHCVRMDQVARAQRFFEYPQQVKLVRQKGALIGNVKAIVAQHVPVTHTLSALEEACK